MRISAGAPHPLGTTWDGRGTNFALFSANAEKVELCLFDSHGRREIERITLPERTEDVWHGYLSDVAPGQLYGYRVHGPYHPERGLRFNAHKLLIDPYAKQLAGRLVWSDAHFGYRAGSARADLSFDRRDNARGVPKSMVVDEAFTWGEERRPSIPWRDTVIYEAHVKGLTQLREDVPPAWRGSYRGLTAPAVVDHLKRLGVTAVELLPIHAFIDDRHLIERGLSNYWGYNTVAFFAPDARYAVDGPLDAFRSTVSRLHDAGIELILDAVYNHTAEGNHLGPTLSFRGIDNTSYYWLLPDQRSKNRREFLFSSFPFFWRKRPFVTLEEVRFQVIRNGDSPHRYLFIHGNEETAREVLTRHMETHPGIAYITENHTRTVSIESGQIDPNRMFSRIGAERNLLSVNPGWPPERCRAWCRTT